MKSGGRSLAEKKEILLGPRLFRPDQSKQSAVHELLMEPATVNGWNWEIGSTMVNGLCSLPKLFMGLITPGVVKENPLICLSRSECLSCEANLRVGHAETGNGLPIQATAGFRSAGVCLTIKET